MLEVVVWYDDSYSDGACLKSAPKDHWPHPLSAHLTLEGLT